MAKKIVWTPEAEETFAGIIDYLVAYWGLRETSAFVNATDRTIEYIQVNPLMFRKTDTLDVHEALITSQNMLIYRIKKDSIELITFWDTRQNPKRKKY